MTYKVSSKVKFQAGTLTLLAVLLIVHFTLTLIFCLPVTPVRINLDSIIQRYMIPLFQQNWSFFAPYPPTASEFILVRYRYKDASGKVSESEWVNLSKTLNRACQKNRLSALEILQLLLQNSKEAVASSEIFKDHVLDSKVLTQEIASGKQPPPLHTIERLGMAFYPQMKFSGIPVSVQVAFLDHEFPRFSHRSELDSLDLNNRLLIFPYVSFEPVTPF